MRGYFGIGIYHPKTVHNVGTLLRSAHNMGAAFMFIVGHRYRKQPSDTTDAARHVPLFEYVSLSEMRANLPKDCLLVGIEQTEASEDVRQFAHPERAVYLLGAEDYGLNAEALALCHRVIEVPSTRCLNVGVAGSIVMYDRLIRPKTQRRNHLIEALNFDSAT